MDSVKSTISSQEPLYKEDCLQGSSSHCCCCLCLAQSGPGQAQPPGPARPACVAGPAGRLARPPRPGQNSCSLRLDINSREYEDFKVIQGYKDLGACRGNAAPKVLEQGSNRSNHAKIQVPDQARHPSPPEVDRRLSLPTTRFSGKVQEEQNLPHCQIIL